MWLWKSTQKEDIESIEYNSFEYDIDKIGIIDESQIRVSDTDLNDPSLLSELNSLQNDEEVDLISFEDSISKESSHQNDTQVQNQREALNLKHKAVLLKREGKKSEALELLKEAKHLENSSTTIDQSGQICTSLVKYSDPPSKPLTTIEKVPMMSSKTAPKNDMKQVNSKSIDSSKPIDKRNSKCLSDFSQGPPDICESYHEDFSVAKTEGDAFTPLENAINEAMKSLLLEAKIIKDSNPQKAAEKFRKYKSLKDELLVIASRRAIPRAIPPLFRWNIISTERTIEDSTLGDDQLRLVIRKIKDLDAVLQEHSSRTLSISYNVGVIKDCPEYHTKQVKYKNLEKIAEFNEENIFTFRRKGSTIESQFTRKKISFTVTLHRGMFQSDKILGIAKLNLSELLTSCKTGGYIQLLDPSGKKAIGGQLEVFVMLRRPISKAEVKVETERELLIEEWPSLTLVDHPPSFESTPPEGKGAAAVTSSAGSTYPHNSTIDFSQLSDLEKTDPLNVNLIVSNDVLENEISSTEASMATCHDSDLLGDLQIKLMILQGKLAVLVNQVQNESLSLEDYLALLRERIESDKRLAVYCNQSNRREEALQVMKRIRIMQKEIASADQASVEEV